MAKRNEKIVDKSKATWRYSVLVDNAGETQTTVRLYLATWLTPEGKERKAFASFRLPAGVKGAAFTGSDVVKMLRQFGNAPIKVNIPAIDPDAVVTCKMRSSYDGNGLADVIETHWLNRAPKDRSEAEVNTEVATA